MILDIQLLQIEFMKNSKFLIFCLLLSLTLLNSSVFAQQLVLGLRDGQFAHVAIDNTWLFGYEQSLLNVKPQEENGKLFIGIHKRLNFYDVYGIAYYGSEFSRHWSVAGLLAKLQYTKEKYFCRLLINDNYDSSLHNQLNYNIKVGYVLYKENAINSNVKVLVTTSFGNIPEYRQNLKSLRIGLLFNSGNLSVHPEISVPGIEDVGGSKHFRVLCNFDWQIDLKKRD